MCWKYLSPVSLMYHLVPPSIGGTMPLLNPRMMKHCRPYDYSLFHQDLGVAFFQFARSLFEIL